MASPERQGEQEKGKERRQKSSNEHILSSGFSKLLKIISIILLQKFLKPSFANRPFEKDSFSEYVDEPFLILWVMS